MFSFITEWLDARRRERVQALYQRGYDWAAGQLLLGVGIDRIEDQIDSMGLFADEHDAFDAGTIAACRDWSKFSRVAVPA